MSADLLTRDLSDRRVPVAAITAGLAIFSIVGLGAASGLEDTVADLTENMPEALTAFIPADVPGGYVVGEVFNLVAPLVLVAYAVMSGASAVAGEEDSGTMSVLISQPVSRTQVLAAKAVGLLTSLLVPIIIFGATALLASNWFDTGLTAGNIAATCLHLFVMAAFFGALALAVGGLTGNPSLAAMVGGAVAAVAYMLDAMLPLADLDGWARLSPWYYYASSTPLANGIEFAHVLVLVAGTAIATAVAFVSFERRDLKG
ncbi:MAG: ABC transporter permease subunit [Aeromicrobium sp.]|uniref:ABC transporter permease subunit n=1 Tax=Aeromicrobium sp. TaxID=1871063 RepID=UPI003C360141